MPSLKLKTGENTMLSKIAQKSSMLEYMNNHFFHALSVNQLNSIKKIAMIAFLTLGITFGIYVLYKVASSRFPKKTSENEEDSNPNPLNINLQDVKDHSSPSKTTPKPTPTKTSPTPISQTILPETIPSSPDHIPHKPPTIQPAVTPPGL